MHSVLKKISTTRLTRQEFLVYVGGVIIGILGIPSILRLLSDVKPHEKMTLAPTVNSHNSELHVVPDNLKPRKYGSGAYGA